MQQRSLEKAGCRGCKMAIYYIVAINRKGYSFDILSGAYSTAKELQMAYDQTIKKAPKDMKRDIQAIQFVSV